MLLGEKKGAEEEEESREGRQRRKEGRLQENTTNKEGGREAPLPSLMVRANGRQAGSRVEEEEEDVLREEEEEERRGMAMPHATDGKKGRRPRIRLGGKESMICRY